MIAPGFVHFLYYFSAESVSGLNSLYCTSRHKTALRHINRPVSFCQNAERPWSSKKSISGQLVEPAPVTNVQNNASPAFKKSTPCNQTELQEKPTTSHVPNRSTSPFEILIVKYNWSPALRISYCSFEALERLSSIKSIGIGRSLVN